MGFIFPVTAGRVSDLLMRSRLLSQMQVDQRELFRIQGQVSTGRRISLPSQDAPAALRAIQLQRLLERKAQVGVNLKTNQSVLSATDAALGNVSSLLADVRGSALTVTGTTSTATQRQAVIEEVQRAIGQLVSTGNQQFRGRYLFAGTRTTQPPFQLDGKYVNYAGNEGELQSYSDLDELFETSINGNEVFGAISEPARGAADLNPVLHANTPLADLHGGLGIGAGSINISDGLVSSIIDISSARTVGDLAKLIESRPPAGRKLTVTIKPTGLDIAIDGGNLQITEVAGGTTARELGILREGGPPTQTIVGQDLDPKLKLTTRLDDVLGSRAFAHVNSDGANNDFRIEAAANGADLNGVAVQFVDDDLLQAAPGLEAGDETAVYRETAQAARASLRLSGADNDLILTADAPGTDFNNVHIVLVNAGDVKNNPTVTYADVAGTRTLTLGIDDSGETTLQDLVDAINNDSPFTAAPDPSAGEGYDGAAAVSPLDAGAVTGNTGNSGGAAKTLYVHVQAGKSTANEAIAAINAEGTFTAALDPRDSITEAQSGLGLVDFDATATTTGGAGIDFDKSSGIRVVNGGKTYDLSFDTAETVEDLLNIINGSGAGMAAQINADATGVVVRSRLSGADFSIGELGGATATQLGIRTFTGDVELDQLNHGRGVTTIDGTDFTIVSNDGAEIPIDLDDAKTVSDVLDAINTSPDNAGRVTARLAAYGGGIELVDDNPAVGGALTVKLAPSCWAAEQLGLVPDGKNQSDPPTPAEAPVAVAELTAPNTDLTFTANQAGTVLGGVQVKFANTVVGDQATVSYDAAARTLTIGVDPTATRAETVVAAVNAEGTFAAALNTDRGPNDGQGIIADVGVVATTSPGAPEVLTGRDVHPQETHGVFNSLIRLKQALVENDPREVQRSLELLDEDMDRVNFGRAEIGARQQGLDTLQARLATEHIELKGALSQEIDVDFAKAISDLTARQFALQAALKTTAGLLQQTLLNYI